MKESQHQFRLHAFVCAKKKLDKVSCGAHITEEMIKELKVWNKENGFYPEVRISQSTCLGLCNSEGGAMLLFDDGIAVQGFKTLHEMKSFLLGKIKEKSINIIK
jgi:NADH:ubiquinone oxidoreductase subunit E